MTHARTWLERWCVPQALFAALFGAALLAMLLTPQRAHAQVAVLRVDPAAELLCEALESALTPLGSVQLVADPGYLREARNQRLDPGDPATLEVLVPLLGLQLAVVPLSADDRSVQVDFRDGRTGRSLGGAALPLDGGLLGFRGRGVLEGEVRARLTGTPPPSAMQGRGQATGEVALDGATGTSEGEDDDGAGDAGDGALIVEVLAGVGIGTRELEWPSDGEQLRVETGMFAAYDLAARFTFVLSDAVAIGPDLAYQSSLAHEVKETHLGGPDETVGIRAHRFAATLAVRFSLGDEGTFTITPALGYAARSLRPDVHHLLTPSYSIMGPLARLTLGVAFGDSFAVRLCPELQLALVGQDLQNKGVDGSGLAVGGEATLALTFSSAVGLELAFRQAHALLSAGEGDASDVERFITTRVRWSP